MRLSGLTPSATTAEIQTAYRRKAMAHHPDRNKLSNATQLFQQINEAHSVLSDPALRAAYDTSTIETSNQTTTAKETKHTQPEPIACSCCNKITAQPRYVIFYEVKSFIVITNRATIQGIFCRECADKKSIKASIITWLTGWWGMPWGVIYSIHAIFHNLVGGVMPNEVNARVLAHQAWYFAVSGKVDIAKAVALDALAFANKLASGDVANNDEIVMIKSHIETILNALGQQKNIARFKNAWHLLRFPFYVQGGIIAALTLYLFAQQN